MQFVQLKSCSVPTFQILSICDKARRLSKTCLEPIARVIRNKNTACFVLEFLLLKMHGDHALSLHGELL